MTTTQLLMPRYIVTADWLNNRHFKVGDILSVNKFYEISAIKKLSHLRKEDNSAGVDIENLEKFPHLFRILHWWEFREVSDMPEYCKLIKARPSYQLKVNCVRAVTFEKTIAPHQWVCDMFPVYVRIEDLLPATEQEYIQYQQTKVK